jgi:hypothetical protein
MTRPFPLRFELPSPAKVLRVERYMQIGGDMMSMTGWRMWLTANGDFTLGTFIQLCDNGDINRVTWHPDGTEDIFIVKDEDA